MTEFLWIWSYSGEDGDRPEGPPKGLPTTTRGYANPHGPKMTDFFWIWGNSRQDGLNISPLSFTTRWSDLKNSVIEAHSAKRQKLGTFSGCPIQRYTESSDISVPERPNLSRLLSYLHQNVKIYQEF